MAPSAGNLQAFKVFVVLNNNKIQQMCRGSSGINRNFKNYPPCIFVFCADPNKSSYYKERGKKLYCIQDATIACSYTQLIATSLGLSSCWVGSFDEAAIQKIVGIKKLFPVALLTLGYSNEKPLYRARKRIELISRLLE